MPEQPNHIETKVTNFLHDVEQQFLRINEETKQQVLLNLKAATPPVSESESIKAVIDQTVAQQNQIIKDNINQSLNDSMPQSVSGSIFGSVLQNLILPTVFNVIAGNKIDIGSTSFREAAGQTLIDIGQSISRHNRRNG